MVAHEVAPDAPILHTDMGNSRLFAREHRDCARYVGAWGWLVWDGRRWKIDDTGGAVRLARRTVQRLFDDAKAAGQAAATLASVAQEAAQLGDDDAVAQAKKAYDTAQKKAAQAMEWAVKSQHRTRIDALLDLAQSEPEIAARPDDFDNAPWLLNVLNGTLDLRTGQLRPHDPRDMLTKLADASYDRAATCPTFDAFLERVQPDPAHRVYMQRSIGYSLTGTVGEQCFWFLPGVGANGKSTMMCTVAQIFGDYGMKIRAETIMQRRFDSIPEEIAAMAGKRFVLVSEIEEGQQINESLVKDLTGGDRMRARYLHKNSFEFDPQAKLWLFGNHKPVVNGSDYGIWRRPRVVPFGVVIPDAEKDPNLQEKLLAERDGILAWAVRGCLDWQRDGLGTPDTVRAAVEQYREENDVIGRFLAECTEMTPVHSMGAGELYQAYRTWAESEGHKPLSNTALGRKLADRGMEKTRSNAGNRYLGLKLATSV